MSKKIYRKCICCGKMYEYCNHCGNENTPWKNLYDTLTCKAVMNIVSAYNSGRVDADAVKKVLAENNVKDYNSFSKDINEVLNSLFAVKEEKKAEPVVEEKPIAQVIEQKGLEAVTGLELKEPVEEPSTHTTAQKSSRGYERKYTASSYNKKKKPWKKNVDVELEDNSNEASR